MAYRIIWTEPASRDVEETVRYLRRRDRLAAAAVGRGIFQRVQILTEFPQTGSVLEQRDDPSWRKLVFKSWLIAYRVLSDQEVIAILRVWHCARGEIQL